MDDAPPVENVPAAAGTVAGDEAGAWELLKRRVAENRKLSTENRKLRNDLGEAIFLSPVLFGNNTWGFLLPFFG